MVKRYLNSLDGRIDSMHRRRNMAMFTVLISVLMWGALVLEYLEVKDLAGGEHHLTAYFMVDVIIFQLALWLTLVSRHIVGVFLFVVLLGFHVWMYDKTETFPPKKAATEAAIELVKSQTSE